MSAFLLSCRHLNAMLNGAVERDLPLHWRHEGKSKSVGNSQNELGQMLLDENIRSVQARYSRDYRSQLPGWRPEHDEPFQWDCCGYNPSPLELLKLVLCYEYQTCEHSAWPDSEAKAFCTALLRVTISRLPGYDEARWYL